ncbi:cation channel sperm-associated auxiliary subunit TMEM249 isoform X4 [Hemicordylus capensis]|uniref:cation channel sperm-associated auxiliary subunit TMEM249 isoform X4 n=1 Tax=Hemicordylus capensis TaxID=884348 RepID=UPI002304BEA1|nr:cation channel sperm-associated auxiliary subunit TMEM249 isoform X4 [Hemicordylus capensis]
MMQWFRGRGAPLVLWQCSFWNVEKTLSNKFQQNKHFPFQVQQPNVFVMEYYKESLWKGLLVFLVFLALTIAYFYTASERTQDLSAGLFFGMLMGVWLILSSMNKRRLIINHVKGVYQFYIKGRLWHESPLHQIYVRLMPQSDAHGKLFFSLIINGYHLEMLTLADLSNKYQEMDVMGRRLARNLNLNYFDYKDISTRHVIRHKPTAPLDPQDPRYRSPEEGQWEENTIV